MKKWMLIIGGLVALVIAYKFILPKLTGKQTMPALPMTGRPYDPNVRFPSELEQVAGTGPELTERGRGTFGTLGLYPKFAGG